MDGTDMSLDLSSKVNDPAPGCTQETESMPLQMRDLSKRFEQLNSLNGMHIVASGVFTDLPDDENNSRLGSAKDLYVGMNFIQRLVLSHGGRYYNRVNTDTTFLVIGDKLGRAKVDKTN